MKRFKDGLLRILLRKNIYKPKERMETLSMAVKWLYRYTVIDHQCSDEAELKSLLVLFFRLLMDYGYIGRKDWVDLKKIMKQGHDRLDIILNGDTFIIKGDEGELLKLSGTIYEHVMEQRIHNFLTGEKDEAEIAFKIKAPQVEDPQGRDEEDEPVEIENIVGLQFIYWLPRHLDVDPVVIYPVLSFRKYRGGQKDSVPEVKEFSRGDEAHMWVFTIETEDSIEEIALDLNDPDIVFIEGKHIARFRNTNLRIK
ncbi:MAG TPA: hypothetical protein ENL15_00220 [Firmicutes bacterium]|nr:hypothetical protein [Bacillota bacterium]